MLAAQRKLSFVTTAGATGAGSRPHRSTLRFVRQDSLYERPIAERHRIVFYIGHLEAFDWNLLRDRVLSVNALHLNTIASLRSGLDPVGGGLPADQPQDWPSLADIRDYVARSNGNW